MVRPSSWRGSFPQDGLDTNDCRSFNAKDNNRSVGYLCNFLIFLDKHYFLLCFDPEGRHFAYCLGDYLGCVKDQFARELIETFEWKTGVGINAVFAPSMAYHGDRAVDSTCCDLFQWQQMHNGSGLHQDFCLEMF